MRSETFLGRFFKSMVQNDWSIMGTFDIYWAKKMFGTWQNHDSSWVLWVFELCYKAWLETSQR